MALTGTFDADFSAFYSAVDLAKSKLLDMAGVAGSTADELAQVLDTDAPEQMHELADATDDVAAANQGASVSIADMVTAYVSAEAIIGAVTAAFTALVEVVQQSITSASEAEDAQVGLEGALRAQGTAVPSVIAAYQEYATALQLTTRYSDDAVVAAEKILVQIGGVMPRDMERALKATTDLAAGLGTDLASAAMMVAKAAEGQTSALQRAGVQVETTKGQTADFGTVLDTITAKFGNQATTMAGTYAGALDQTANAWDNLLESVGRTITQNETVKTALAGINSLLTTNTGELNQNASANRLVSEAVILLAKGFSLAVEGIDYFQKELRDATKLADVTSLGFVHFYELLQKIEIATQTPIAWAGGAAAKERIREAGEALEWAGGAAQGLRDHMAEADATSQQWSETLQGFRGNLDTLITKLETTRGQTVAVTTAQAEAAGVWDRQTGAISAQTMALQEHAMAQEGLKKGMFEIDAQATALAKSQDAAVLAEITGREQAEAAFWKMHDAEEQAAMQTQATAETTATAVTQMAGTVTGALSTMEGAWTSYADKVYAAQHLTQDYLGSYGGPLSAGQVPISQGFGSAGLINSISNQGSTVNIASGAIQMQYPIMNDPTAMDQLARHVGDAVMSKLTRAGARL